MGFSPQVISELWLQHPLPSVPHIHTNPLAHLAPSQLTGTLQPQQEHLRFPFHTSIKSPSPSQAHKLSPSHRLPPVPLFSHTIPPKKSATHASLLLFILVSSKCILVPSKSASKHLTGKFPRVSPILFSDARDATLPSLAPRNTFS